MIGQLRGKLVWKQPPYLLIDVQGVGYEIEAPMTTFYALPAKDEEIILYTHLLVRDDAHRLFGFASVGERKLFRDLIKINGVGAKMALTILSGIEAGDFARCIQDNDSVRLTRLPGVGKKTAERLIIEMRDRLKDWDNEGAASPAVQNISSDNRRDSVTDAVSALISLGYKPQEASRFVHAVATDDMGSEDIIREALKASVK